MTEPLTQKEQRLLKGLRWGQPVAVLIGLVLILAGGAYTLWGVQRFTLRGAVDLAPAFDHPIAQLETLFVQKEEELKQLQPHTDLESQLLKQLILETDLNRRVFILLFRFLLGNLLVVSGVIQVAVCMSRRPLLSMIRKYRGESA